MLSHSVVSNSETQWTVARQAPLSMGIFQARILEWVAMPSSRDLSHSGVEPRSPIVQVDSLLSKPPRKPRNKTESSTIKKSHPSMDAAIRSQHLQLNDVLRQFKTSEESDSESCSVVSNSLQCHGLYRPSFSRPEPWSGQPFPSPRDLPDPEIESGSPALQADSLPAETAHMHRMSVKKNVLNKCPENGSRKEKEE